MEDNSEGGGDADHAQDDEGEQVESKVLWKLLQNHHKSNCVLCFLKNFLISDLIFVLRSQLRRL